MTQTITHIETIANQLQLNPAKVKGSLALLGDGCTIPFIARYRKEATGSLDEVDLTTIRDLHNQLQELDSRRKTILASLEKTDNLSPALKSQIETAQDLTVLEDLYLPFRPKRKTRAQLAREKGLEPLAKIIETNSAENVDWSDIIHKNPGVTSKEVAIQGAQDIVAENISEHLQSREQLRKLFDTAAILSSEVIKKNQEQGEKFKDYFGWEEVATKAPSHRVLAMFRGENEKILKLRLRPPEQQCIDMLLKRHIRPGPWKKELQEAIGDCYHRLLGPSLENELRKKIKDEADREAITVFSQNLKQLLLAPPLGSKRVLAIDPGYRTGCKTVCLNEQGDLLYATTIYPTQGQKQQLEAEQTLLHLVDKYSIQAIGIGNGTAGRETERFTRVLPFTTTPGPIITLVNEDGASIYSASETARTEFPDQDITVRGAVSIGRRLQDPLAELVKIDPKSIGVGQYQHDVNQSRLKLALQDVVESCVNSVGVELNNASVELLTFVSGLGETLAKNIVAHREQHGPFTDRRQLLNVPRLGPKAFEQCAGFLRIRNGKNPLDASGVHPERYKLVQRMAHDCRVSLEQLLLTETIQKKIDVQAYLDDKTGRDSLTDILLELAKPGRDPRQSFTQVRFDDTIASIEDIQEGMILPAVITNITRFGAFADVGIKNDGLIHISQMADRFVNDPAEIVSLGQKVEVRVLEVDEKRGRISLSLKKG